jgi:hypothetical protein
MSLVEEFDTGEEGAIAPSDALSRLRQNLAELLDMEALVERMEEDLKAAKQTLQSLRTGRIPDLMSEVGVSSMTIDDKTIDLADFVSGSLPKDPEKRRRAIEWLENEGADGMIKTEVTVEFGRNQHKEALRLGNVLMNDGYAPSVNSSIASQTLLKFARDRLAAGEPIDFEILGLYTGKVAKVKGAKR